MLWDANKLLGQLALGEDSRVEFKEVVFTGSRVREPRRQRVANELAAFGNTLGGALIFSVSDAGEVRPMNREMMDALEAYVSEICADSIDPPLHTSKGRPLGGATILALYPNKTWMMEETDAFGCVQFGFHSELPIIVFCAAPGHRARVERSWCPPAPLLVELETLEKGGSMVIPEQTGHLPGLAGRLNPILDNLDRMYLHATNVAINDGRQQPVHFKLGEAMRLTDVHGAERLVRFIDMIGNSSVLEYTPPPSRS